MESVHKSESLAETNRTSLARPALRTPRQPEQSSALTACIIRAQRGTSQKRPIVAKGEHTYAKCDADLVQYAVDAIERKIAVANRKAEIYRKETERMRSEFQRTRLLLTQLNEMRASRNLPRIALGAVRGRGKQNTFPVAPKTVSTAE